VLSVLENESTRVLLVSGIKDVSYRIPQDVKSPEVATRL